VGLGVVMPIRPENRARYPRDWRSAIVPAIRARSGDHCEGSPAYPLCRAANGQPHPVTGSRVVLTVAHLDHDDLGTRDLTRLRHWCQRCHNTYDVKHRQANATITRAEKAGQSDLWGRR